MFGGPLFSRGFAEVLLARVSPERGGALGVGAYLWLLTGIFRGDICWRGFFGPLFLGGLENFGGNFGNRVGGALLRSHFEGAVSFPKVSLKREYGVLGIRC